MRSPLLSNLTERAISTVLRHVPPGSARDELVSVIRVGSAFVRQQCGGKHGPLTAFVSEVTDALRKANKTPSFENLLDALDTLQVRHDRRVEEVDRIGQFAILYLPGRREVAFKTLRNALTKARKIISPTSNP